jgi:hypothetical protein
VDKNNHSFTSFDVNVLSDSVAPGCVGSFPGSKEIWIACLDAQRCTGSCDTKIGATPQSEPQEFIEG